MKTTIKELTELLDRDTEIFLVSREKRKGIELRAYILAYDAIGKMELNINSIRAIGTDKIEIIVDMPDEILQAWDKIYY